MVVAQNQEQRRNWGRYSADRSEKGTITKSDLSSATHIRHKVGRLFGDPEKSQKNIDSVALSKNENLYEAYGLDCYTICGQCKRASVNFFPHKGSQKSKTFFDEYHSEHFFGLARGDIKLHGKRKKDWKSPTAS